MKSCPNLTSLDFMNTSLCSWRPCEKAENSISVGEGGDFVFFLLNLLIQHGTRNRIRPFSVFRLSQDRQLPRVCEHIHTRLFKTCTAKIRIKLERRKSKSQGHLRARYETNKLICPDTRKQYVSTMRRKPDEKPPSDDVEQSRK